MGDEWKAGLAAVVYVLTCATIAGYMASRKNRSVGLWCVLGGSLGIVGIIILGFLDDAGVRWSADRKRRAGQRDRGT